MAWVSMGRLLVATKGLPPAREVCPLRVRWMDAGAPGERSNQHGEPRRSLEGLDCLGMLPATPANMRPACGTWRRPSVGNRQCAGTAFREKEEPRRGRSEEHTSELQSLMRISYAVFCLKKKKNTDI